MVGKRRQGFQPGVSGNPKGKPPGSGWVADLRRKIMDRVPEVIEKLVEQSLAGDAQSSKLLLERVFPIIRPGDIPIKLPLPKGNRDINDAARAVLEGMVGGEIAPDGAKTLSDVLATLARIREALDLIPRIERLENQHDGDLPPLVIPEQRLPPRWEDSEPAQEVKDEDDPE